jgi:predicted ArsR family transcriptional regulator
VEVRWVKLKEGERSVQIGKLNRNNILKKLLESPSTFTELQKKVDVSGKTLANHLRTLQEEGLVQRKIQGKYIKYVVARPQTVLQMRKDFQKEFMDLIIRYNSCLDTKTHKLLAEPLKALQESIEHPEPEAETAKIFGKSVKIPKGFSGTIDINFEEPYGKPKLIKKKESPKRGRPKG